MNCTGNQLAIIVSGMENGKKHIGKIIRITKLHWFFRDCWEYEGDTLPTPDGNPISAIEDECLRPIRPGESPEESIEAMRLLTYIPSKEPVLSHQLDEVKANIADLNEMRKYRGSQS